MIQCLMKKILSAWWLLCIVIGLCMFIYYELIGFVLLMHTDIWFISHVWTYLFQAQSITKIHKFYNFWEIHLCFFYEKIFMKRCLYHIYYIPYSNRGLIKTTCFAPVLGLMHVVKSCYKWIQKKAALSKGNES